ncbi:DUF418 domain-containing protein [Aquimarina litoralis]|uniref:DUF418 domain-containing protein n=2 Tax=Aquimarina litoralis TaxID=584605 RepID=A0ABP3UAK4_9FLAO
MLLHSIEHFDIYYFPEHLPAWMKTLDGAIWETMFFLFSGKSYSIFALLFGVTYAIQLSRQKEKGQSFAGRFAWRMVLLFAFGILNSAFFQGDVLTIYAVLGVLLIPFSKLKDSIILGIAIILLVLPYEWTNLIYALQHPDEKINDPISWSYFGKMLTYVGEPSLWDTIIGNLTNGKIGVLRWNWENGRFFTILALFLLGYLLGKHQKFHETDKNLEFWTQVLKISIIAFIPLYLLKRNMDHFIESDIIRRSALTIETSITNFSFMLVLVSGITLLFYKTKAKNALMYFSRFGRMSMSNYIIQSILGGAIFYGWGLGLYKYTGATYGLLIGLALTIIIGIFCKWWAKRYKQGPFETVWHKATWM